MLHQLPAEILHHILRSTCLRERITVLLTSTHCRDAVNAARDDLFADLSLPANSWGWETPVLSSADGTLSVRGKIRGLLLPAGSHATAGSLKNVCLAGGGAASLACGDGTSLAAAAGIKWLGTNFVTGVILDRVEICGHTTLIGCTITDCIKIGPNAKLELIGCTVHSHYPHGIRVGKMASLACRDSRFIHPTREVYVQSARRFVAGRPWVDMRPTLSEADRLGSGFIHYIRAQRCRSVDVQNCSFAADTMGFQRMDAFSIEVGHQMEHFAVEDCEVATTYSCIMLLRGLPEVVRIQRNRLAGKVFINHTEGVVTLKDNVFTRPGMTEALELHHGVRAELNNCNIAHSQVSTSDGSSYWQWQ